MNDPGLDIIRAAVCFGRKRTNEARLREMEQSELERAAGKRPSRQAAPSRGLWFRIRENEKQLLIRAAEAVGAGNLSGWAKKVLIKAACEILDPRLAEHRLPQTRQHGL